MKKINRNQIRKLIKEVKDHNDIQIVINKTKAFINEFDRYMQGWQRFIRNAWYNDRRTHAMKKPYMDLVKSIDLGVDVADIDITTIKSNISIIITELDMNIRSKKVNGIKQAGYEVLKEIDRIENTSI